MLGSGTVLTGSSTQMSSFLMKQDVGGEEASEGWPPSCSQGTREEYFRTKNKLTGPPCSVLSAAVAEDD